MSRKLAHRNQRMAAWRRKWRLASSALLSSALASAMVFESDEPTSDDVVVW